MAVPVQVDLNPNARKVEAALARIKAQAKGINLGGGAESINKLSRPLGKITGQASEFQKSLEASNARVLAFGASVAVINKLSQAFGALVTNTIKVEASFAKINTILGGTKKELEAFGNGIFKVAQQTGTSFDQVAEGALELARQGLSVEESLSRVSTALKLVRVSGIDAEKAVGGLTAAVKGFEGAGLSVSRIADKLAEVDTKFAVSTEDLINGLERASASARVAGVSFDELLGVVTTVQERTQRGGAVIGNAFKTIFARLGRTDTLQTLKDLGIEVLDTEGNVRSAIPLFKELAVELDKLGLKSVEAGEIIQKVAGVRQRDILISLIEDLNSGQSQFAKALQVSAGAAGALDAKNAQLNNTLEALINNLTVGGQKLASVLGEIGFTDAAKDILKIFSSVVNSITDILQGDSIGAKFAQGLIKGVGSVLTGPGLALISAIFIKLFVDLAKFGATSLKQILGINKAAAQQATLQQSVLQTLLQNENIQREILALEGNKVAQEQLLLKIYNQQAAALARVQKAAATVTPGLFGAGLRGGEGGVKTKGRASGGYIAAEARDVSRSVGGAPASSKVVSIPNFAFGGGKRGTMVANTSEYIVPNFAGGGDAIFNRDMVRSMGLPAGARKINAAGGFIPNFSRSSVGAGLSKNNPYRYRSLGELNKIDSSKLEGKQLKDYEAALAAKGGGPAIGAISKNKNQVRSLELIANGQIGVASLFPESPATSVTTTRLSRDDLAALKSRGYSNVKSVTLRGIQNKSLRDYKKNKKAAEADLRKRLVDFFTKPLIQFGNSIISKDFQNDEAASIKAELQKSDRDPNLFSTSVQGGLLESAIRLVTQKAAGIKDFKDNKGDGAAFDFEEVGEASSDFKKAFGFSDKVSRLKADAKRTASSEAIRTLIGKTLRDPIAFGLVEKVGRASNGYIPNFAAGNYVFDSDRLDRKTANVILKTILETKKKKDLLIAPAGTGKSTAAAKLGKFIASPNDVKKAESFTILSGAARAKNSLMSAGLSSIIDAVNSSGGRVSYLYAKNMDVLSRRFGRVSQGSDDLRTTKQLRGTIKAPLNQFDFIKGVKSASRRFSIMRGAEGFMPELGDAISREVSAGVPLNQVRINQSGKLRNAQNPMGLAVTNIRDEPTGAIPNFAVIPKLGSKGSADKAAQSAEKMSNSFDGLTTKLIGLQLVMSATTNAFSEQNKTLQNIQNGLGSFLNLLTVLSLTGGLGGESDPSRRGAVRRGFTSFKRRKGLGRVTGGLTGAIRGADARTLAKGGLVLGGTDAALKILGEEFGVPLEGGLLQAGSELLGAVTGSTKRKTITGATGSRLKNLRDGGFKGESSVVGAMSAISFIQAELAETSDEKTKRILTGQLKAAQSLLEEFQGLQKKQETLAAKIKSGEVILKEAASRGVSGFFGRRETGIIVNAARKQAEQDAKLRKTENLEDKAGIEIEKERLGILEEIQLSRNEGLNDLTKEVVEKKGLNGIEKESLKTVLSLVDENKTLPGLVAELKTNFGLTNEEAEKLYEKAKLQKQTLSEQEARALSLLGIRKEQLIAEAKIAEAQRRFSNSYSIATDLVKQSRISKQETSAVLGLSLRDGTALSPQQKRDIEFEIGQIERQNKILQITDKQADIRAEIALEDAKGKQKSESALEKLNAQLQTLYQEEESLERINALEEKRAKEIKNQTKLQQSNEARRQALKDLGEDVPARLADNLESSLGTAFNNIATGAYDSLGNVMLQVALDFGQAIQKELANAAAKQVVGGITSSSGGGGFFNFIGDAFKGFGFNSGGLVSGGSGVRDDIPAKLTGGEYVIKKSAVQKYGVDFLDRLNSQGISKMQSGGFFVPGTRGQGVIKGKKDLLAFANQEFTSGATDIMTSSGSGAFIDLEDQSARLSTFGRFRESPARRALKDAQNQALDLYNQQIQEEERIREAKKQRSRQLKSAIFGSFLSAGIYGGVSGLGGLFNRRVTPPTPSTSVNSPTSFSGSSGYNLYGSSFGFANGGVVSGGSNALLMGGEYIVSAPAAAQIGRGNLDNINMMNFSNGGAVGNVASSSGETTSADIGEVNITINMEKGDATVENSSKEGGDITQTKEFAKKIKDVVVGVINEEKRVSGSLFSRRK